MHPEASGLPLSDGPRQNELIRSSRQRFGDAMKLPKSYRLKRETGGLSNILNNLIGNTRVKTDLMILMIKQ